MQPSDDERELRVEKDSKSQRKKQMTALQDIGKILVELPAPQLARVPMDERLATAVHAAREIKSREGLRRQLQYIGRIMRNTDTAPLLTALDKVQTMGQLSKAKFHQVERWRDQMIAEGDAALENFLVKYPQADSQQIRQLIRKAQSDVKRNKNTGGSTALFRLLLGIADS
jgi:ribosome-associated protein